MVKKHKHIINLCNKHIKALYSENYDAYYCPYCCRWLENKCGDKECKFCRNRPNKPTKLINKNEK